MIKTIKYFALTTIVLFSLMSSSAFSEDPPPPPTPIEGIAVTDTYEAPSFWGFLRYLFTGNIGGGGSSSNSATTASNNDVRKLCASNPDAAKTTSTADADSRWRAANAIIQTNMQGLLRIQNNNRILPFNFPMVVQKISFSTCNLAL